MLGAGIYPITLAEMVSYSQDADALFENEEHERLKEFLALHPECGDVLPDTGGVRVLAWPLKNPGKAPRFRIAYYFRDLNMPLYLLAIYQRGEVISLAARSRVEMKKLVAELVEEHSRGWARMIRPGSSA